jgi:hypothetical protein
LQAAGPRVSPFNAAADRQQGKSEQDRAVWGNLNVHKSHDMRAFVAAQPWLEVAYLPVSWEHG